MEQKGQRRGGTALFAEPGRPPSPALRHQGFRLSGLRTESLRWLPQFPSLQMAGVGLLASIIMRSISVTNQSLFLSTYISYWFAFSGKL